MTLPVRHGHRNDERMRPETDLKHMPPAWYDGQCRLISVCNETIVVLAGAAGGLQRVVKPARKLGRDKTAIHGFFSTRLIMPGGRTCKATRADVKLH